MDKAWDKRSNPKLWKHCESTKSPWNLCGHVLFRYLPLSFSYCIHLCTVYCIFVSVCSSLSQPTAWSSTAIILRQRGEFVTVQGTYCWGWGGQGQCKSFTLLCFKRYYGRIYLDSCIFSSSSTPKQIDSFFLGEVMQYTLTHVPSLHGL